MHERDVCCIDAGSGEILALEGMRVGERTMDASYSPASPLRRAKLRRPRIVDHAIERPRLLARLGSPQPAPLTLITAPAGFGKTTLIAQWLAASDGAAGWVTLDPGDADVERLAAYMLAALGPTTDPTSIAELFPPTRPLPAAEIGAALAECLLDLANDVVLVLDDCQHIATADVAAFLERFLALAPPTLHLALISRIDLPLAVGRLRAQGLVRELRAADLRFTAVEAQALAAAFAPEYDDPAIAASIQAQTEGWPAGLRLAAQALGSLSDPERLAALDGRRHIAQFLVEEVLAAQRPAVQDLLLRASIVERPTGPLLDALLDEPAPGGSAALLEQLAASDLFLAPIGGELDAYRFHPLFRDLLLHQLARRFPRGQVIDLHRRAAAWYAARNEIDDALAQLLAADDLTGAAKLVERRYHHALDSEDWPALARWLQPLPEKMVHAYPHLLLARSWVAHLSGRAQPLRGLLEEATALLERGDLDPALAEAAQGEIDVLSLSTLLPIEQHPTDALRRATRSTIRVPAARRFPYGLAHGQQGLALAALGRQAEGVRRLTRLAEQNEERIDAGSIRPLLGLIFIHRQTGNFAECVRVARHTLRLTERAGLPVTAGWAHLFLGWLAYERGDLDAAAAHFGAIVADYRRVHLSCTREALFGLALTQEARGHALAADDTVQRLTEIIIDSAALEHLPVVHGFEARLALLRGQPDSARRWLANTDVGLSSNTLHAFEHAMLTKVKTLLADRSDASLAAAWAAVEALRTRAERTNHIARLAEIHALAALALDARGEPAAADAALESSFAIGEPAGFCRTYVDLGPALRPLLARAQPHALARSLLDRERVTAAAVVAPAATIQTLLTPRECDVLDCLGQRLSYQEIADRLFISPLTVKRHIGNIYGKLEAGNRREALAAAQSMGWRP
ncbi:MAG: AAA family ATPase [Thermomicrobiales bacterium]|nr:AAA family ATPase [Thermomicrobiales bacterium]